MAEASIHKDFPSDRSVSVKETKRKRQRYTSHRKNKSCAVGNDAGRTTEYDNATKKQQWSSTQSQAQTSQKILVAQTNANAVYEKLSSSQESLQPTVTENQEEAQQKIPIAFGPCRYFRKIETSTSADGGNTTAESRPTSCSLSTSQMNHLMSNWCCWVQTNDMDQDEEDRVWRKCFLTLFSDSTMVVQEGQGQDSAVIISVRLDDVYREVKFGEMVAGLPGYASVPPTENRSLKTVLAVPDEPHCNSTINWLDFLTLNTLNKWLLAFCRAISVEKLNEKAHSKAAKKELRALQQQPHSSGTHTVLKNHIQLFFPSAIHC